MSDAPKLPLAQLIWSEPCRVGEGAKRDLQVLTDGVLRLARQSSDPEEKAAFEALAAGARRLA